MRDAGLFFRQNIAAISSSQLEEETAKAIVESMENFHVNYGFIMSRRASQIETKDHVHVATVCSNGNLIHRLYIFLFFSSCFFSPELITNASSPTTTISYFKMYKFIEISFYPNE